MRIGFILSENYGFSNWKKLGSFEREMLIYLKLAEEGNHITVFSYKKIDIKETLHSRIKVVVFPLHWLPCNLVIIRQLLMPIFFYKILTNINILITNQAHNGGWVAVWTKLFIKIKVIARCGYIFGEQMSSQKFIGFKHKKRRWLEKLTFKYSNLCFVPTHALANWAKQNYFINNKQIKIVPNFVDISKFKPIELNHNNDLIYIGRLHEEKRPFVVLDAAKCLSLSVCFIGTGRLKEKISKYAEIQNLNLTIIDSLNNSDLPNYLNRSKYFVTGSIWEGHPKAIIEAMSCGCVCICPRSPGISNLITHGINGLLYDGSPEDLSQIISNIENEDFLYKSIKNNARNFCVENYSFDRVLLNYKNALHSII